MTHTAPSELPSPSDTPSKEWPVFLGLVLLSVVPIVAGGFRIYWLSGGAETDEANARFFDDPLPVVVHIVSAGLFCVVGAFQFGPERRRRHLRRHRMAGRALAPLGLAAALSGVWMTLFYPAAPHDSVVLYGMRLLVGPAMAGFIALGLVALVRRQFHRHGEWMLRGYAIGMGAGTQVFTSVPWLLIDALKTDEVRALLMGAGWAINAVVAEAVIRRRRRRGESTSAVPRAP